MFVQFCISELPPAPINIQSADVKQTEAVVTWSHPEFYDISSYSLQVGEFATKKWTQLTTTRGVNHRLTNLDPDTVYFVRLKSENKYGKGKPSDSGELRTEKGMFQTLLLCEGLFVAVYLKSKSIRHVTSNVSFDFNALFLRALFSSL